MASARKAKKATRGGSKGSGLEQQILKLQAQLDKLQKRDQVTRRSTVSKADLETYYRVWSLFHHDYVAGAHATRCSGCHSFPVQPAGRARVAKLGG